MIRAVYHFHVYYHVRRVLKRLQTPLPHETGFNAADNPYTESDFFLIHLVYHKEEHVLKHKGTKEFLVKTAANDFAAMIEYHNE